MLMAKVGKSAPTPTDAATEFVEGLAELRGDYSLALIVFDTLASVMLGLDENNVGDMQATTRTLSEIARAGYCAVQVVQHTRKASAGKPASASDVRGSSALIAAARCVTTLRENLQWSCTKRNGGAKPAPVQLERASVPVVVVDPRSPGTTQTCDYAVLHPAARPTPFGTRHSADAAYAALAAAVQAGNLELRNAGKARGEGWARPQSVIAEALGVSKPDAEALFTGLLDGGQVRLVAAHTSRLDERGRKRGGRSREIYELAQQAPGSEMV